MSGIRLYRWLSVLVVISLLTSLWPLPVRGAEMAPAPNRAPGLTSVPSGAGAVYGPAPQAVLTTGENPPLSLSRVQSAYTPGGAISQTLAITLTVRNTLEPTTLPALAEGATLTETLAALAAYDLADDPHTLRDVLVADVLSSTVALIAASPAPSRAGDALQFNLGDIPPLGSAAVVLTLTVPASVAAPTFLDDGAVAYANARGAAASAAAPPAVLLPDSLGDWLIWTPDADLYDEVMLATLGELGGDPADLFAFVQALGYESYEGSLRGTRGTLWSGAGNSLDQSSLLIALLRASGVPARYRHGDLAAPDARDLIAAMFPEPTDFVGAVPDDVPVGDPLNDPALLAEAADHWWVEAFVPGTGWIDLDPSFAAATPGQVFAAPALDGTDRIAEVPDDVRHKVTVRLVAEEYYPLNLGGTLELLTPLEHTFNSVALAADTVSLSHFVVEDYQPGLIFVNSTYDYTPYLLIGDQIILGETYRDLFTNFPLGTVFHTAAWLEFDLIRPGGALTTYRRELVDRLGPEARLNGGNITVDIPTDDPRLFDEVDVFTTGFWPNLVPAEALALVKADVLDALDELVTDGARLAELADVTSLTPEETAELQTLRANLQLNVSQYLSNIGLSYAEAADRALVIAGTGTFVKSYYDEPRLVTVATGYISPTIRFNVDLRHTAARAIAYPDQAQSATVGFNIVKGFTDSYLEGVTLANATGEPAVSTWEIFAAADEQGIETVIVEASNLSTLDSLAISPQGKARIVGAVNAGRLVRVPAAAVAVAGAPRTGWWESNSTTGETIGVMDTGLNTAAIEYLGDIALGGLGGPVSEFAIGLGAGALEFVANAVSKVMGDGTTVDLSEAASALGTMLSCVQAIAGAFFVQGAIYGAYGCGGGGFFDDGYEMMLNYLNSVVSIDPPLGDAWTAYPRPDNRQSSASADVPVAVSLPTGAFAADLTASFATISATLTGAWTTGGQTALPLGALSVADAQVADAAGNPLGSGAVAAAGLGPSSAALAPPGTDLALEAAGSGAFFAEATDGLGAGTTWSSYTATLTTTAPYVLTLTRARLALDNVLYEGDFTLTTSETTILTGAGGPTPGFAPGASVALASGQLAVGPATGGASLGGVPIDPSGGLALLDFTGSVTVTEAGPALDNVVAAGSGDLFTLVASPASSTTDPVTPVAFAASLEATFAGTFSVTVTAPDGWDVALDGAGNVLATPPPGATPGSYDILLSARPAAAPGLALSAIHTVTVTPYDGLELAVAPNNLVTVPMGQVLSPLDIPGTTNTGQAQVPGAAYTIHLTNTSTVPHTYTVAVSGLPAGWALLSPNPGATSAVVRLPAGGLARLGLYVTPDDLPAAGTTVPFTVEATPDSGAPASDDATFVMPAVTFSYAAVEPFVAYAAPDSTFDFDLTVTNVGNAPGSFPASLRLPLPDFSPAGGPTSPISLAPGASAGQTISVSVGALPVGQIYPIYVDVASPGTPYTQTTGALVQIVTPGTLPAFEAAEEVGLCLDDDLLAGAFAAAAAALATVEDSCDGACDANDQAAAAAAVAQLEDLLAQEAPGLALADLAAGRAALAAAGDEAEVLAALDALGSALGTAAAGVCEAAQHRVVVRFSPTYDAILLGETTTFTVTLANAGTVTTTYDLTTTLPGGPATTAVALDPGQETSLAYPVGPLPEAFYALAAEAVATGPNVTADVRASAGAGLNVVDRFVQLTRVAADPPFVETGVSSTTLGLTVDNIAGLPLPVTARARILAPGGAVSATADVPLTIGAGGGLDYDLATVDTSGWAAGVYTITVDLLDGSLALVPNGAGYGLLAVGQGLVAASAAFPTLVPPGTVTVTTAVTTTVTLDVFTGLDAGAPPPWEPAGLRALPPGHVETTIGEAGETLVRQGPALPEPAPAPAPALEAMPAPEETPDEALPDEEGVLVVPPTRVVSSAGISRTEESNPAFVYAGSWSSVNGSRASAGSYQRSNTAEDTASLAFAGTWLGLGFVAGPTGGQAELFLDGASLGVLDLYRREEQAVTFAFPGLTDAPHTLTVTVLGTANPLATNTRVQLDFADTWDGLAMADGTFEQDDPRLFLSTGWSSVNNAAASGGSYIRSTSSTAWFPFTGDSVTFRALAYPSGGTARISVDGRFLADLDLVSATAVSRTISFAGLGAGPHVLQVSSYRSMATVDTFTTPGSPPFYAEPDPVGIRRYEEDHPALRYNGAPFTATATSWSDVGSSLSSDGYQARSNTAGDTVSLAFSGPWVGVGFTCGTFCGETEIFIDGESQGVLDLYRREDIAITAYYTGLVSATHTISLTVLGSSNPNASAARVNLDFFDTWDGSPMADGAYEEDDSRLLLSPGWFSADNEAASGGFYARSGASTAWFPFTGDSVTYRALAASILGEAKVFVDGDYRTTLDLYSPDAISRTLSFEGLGPGPHVLQVSSYRSQASLDAFATPGSGPFYTPPAPTGVVRYEEDSPAIFYNQQPYTRTAQSWTMIGDGTASGGYYLRSNTGGDTVAFTFTGTWAGVGFVGGNGAGEAEIFLDGESQGVIDLYRRETTAISRYVDGLVDATHTLSVTVLGTANPLANNQRVNLDFFDAWDGAAMPDGTFEAELGNRERLHLSGGWSRINSDAVSGGTYLRTGSNASAWFPFTGDTVTYQAVATSLDGVATVYVDGQRRAVLNLFAPSAVTRTLSFDGLGAGAHVLHVAQDRGQASVDTFATPGTGPFYGPPAPAGIVRFEEDDPALRYNGAPYTSTATSWIETGAARASRGYAARSDVLSDTVSLTFAGSWVSLGLLTAANGGEAAVYLDGALQGVVDTYAATADVIALFYGDLGPGPHMLELVVLDSANPSASGTRVHLDYVDVWDGAAEPDGWFETDRGYQENDRVDLGTDWSYLESAAARGGDYYRNGTNAWFRFTGDALTVRGISDGLAGASFAVFIDGVAHGVFDLQYDYSTSPLPFHFTGLGAGPHVARVAAVGRASVDAFEANPTTFDRGAPRVEWAETQITGDIRNAAVAGDINDDGVVEIVATSTNGTLYVYRGDGADAGGGSPILWSASLGGEPDSPAIAELDGEPGAEIVVGSPSGLYAFHADGSLYWFTDTVRSAYLAASIGNVDADPEPEIVATGGTVAPNVGCPCILEPDGSAIAWRGPLNDPLPANLADLTGDGRLDILVADGDTLYLYDTATSPPTLAWSTEFTTTIEGRGTPSIADLDGGLPSGDPGPEIAVVGDGYVHLVDADGAILWSTATAPGVPGGTSVADLTGDGIPEIVATAQAAGGRLYAFDGAGDLLWEAPALDSTSANSVSVLDLDGDGIWEVVWNGFDQGLTIFRGSDGAILFNEPLLNSITRADYPIIADVDLDGHAEIVTNDGDGIYVVGWDDVWAASRPLWNQYNYAITNIGDNLDVPPDEPASWLVHNTYRTQTPLASILPTYAVAVTHTVPLTGVEVLTSTFVIPPAPDANPYGWGYAQAWYQPTQGNRFDAVLADMAPGEVRAVAEGSEVVYTLPSGSNRLTLPPLYVSAAHIVAVTPSERTVSPGGTTVYGVALTNPLAQPAAYTLTVAGLSGDWLVDWPATAVVPAAASLTLPLTVTVPPGTPDGELPFAVAVETADGGADRATATLAVRDAFDLAVGPGRRDAAAGVAASFTVTLTNRLAGAQLITLTASGLPDVALPAPVALPGGGVVAVPITVTGWVNGANPFAVAGVNGEGATDADGAILAVSGSLGVAVTLAPATAGGGVGAAIPLTATVTNLGSVADSYALSVTVPAGWGFDLTRQGVPLAAVSVPALLANAADLALVVTAPPGTAPGAYPVSLTATSAAAPAVAASATATVTLGGLGVDVAIQPTVLAALLPTDSGSWGVLVTNLGTGPDSFALSAAGIFANVASFTPPTVALAAGESALVTLTTDPIPFALPGTVRLIVEATSQSDGGVRAVDSLEVDLLGYEDVAVAIEPALRTIDLPRAVTFMMAVTNTGNLAATFNLAGAFGGLAGGLAIAALDIPAHGVARVPIVLRPTAAGTYPFSATAASTGASGLATATLVVLDDPMAVRLGRAGAAPAAPPLWGAAGLALALATVWVWRRRQPASLRSPFSVRARGSGGPAGSERERPVKP